MPETASFDYAILRLVPRVERQEFINAGVIVYCPEKRYLAARVRLDRNRIQALWPDLDLTLVEEHLQQLARSRNVFRGSGPNGERQPLRQYHRPRRGYHPGRRGGRPTKRRGPRPRPAGR